MITLQEDTTAATEFTIEPRGPYSLVECSGFGFGPRADARRDPLMRLAFPVDGGRETAGVVLSQDEAGIVHGLVQGASHVEAVRGQVARILSLDHDGAGWAELGRRDPVLGALQAAHPGFRPVLFHSPYEAAAWSVIAGHRAQRQAAGVRRWLGERAGRVFDLAGERLAAFPTPARLLEVDAAPGLSGPQVARLHAVAEAALAGRLDADRLRAMDVEEARAEVRRIPGIGPFYSSLVVIRGAGPADALAFEPKGMNAAAHYYGLRGASDADLVRLAERWRPYRTWAIVLIRFAAYAEGVA